VFKSICLAFVVSGLLACVRVLYKTRSKQQQPTHKQNKLKQLTNRNAPAVDAPVEAPELEWQQPAGWQTWSSWAMWEESCWQRQQQELAHREEEADSEASTAGKDPEVASKI
jgi:hypothetical protein